MPASAVYALLVLVGFIAPVPLLAWLERRRDVRRPLRRRARDPCARAARAAVDGAPRDRLARIVHGVLVWSGSSTRGPMRRSSSAGTWTICRGRTRSPPPSCGRSPARRCSPGAAARSRSRSRSACSRTSRSTGRCTSTTSRSHPARLRTSGSRCGAVEHRRVARRRRRGRRMRGVLSTPRRTCERRRRGRRAVAIVLSAAVAGADGRRYLAGG